MLHFPQPYFRLVMITSEIVLHNIFKWCVLETTEIEEYLTESVDFSLLDTHNVKVLSARNNKDDNVKIQVLLTPHHHSCKNSQ